mmetsp:Transcript_52879/g.113337  ORF Transcript_52879/g.113337 Transcript_52879/m.113337 type:complete len:209 (-) Transcript_52879:69-695(-)
MEYAILGPEPGDGSIDANVDPAASKRTNNPLLPALPLGSALPLPEDAGQDLILTPLSRQIAELCGDLPSVPTPALSARAEDAVPVDGCTMLTSEGGEVQGMQLQRRRGAAGTTIDANGHRPNLGGKAADPHDDGGSPLGVSAWCDQVSALLSDPAASAAKDDGAAEDCGTQACKSSAQELVGSVLDDDARELEQLLADCGDIGKSLAA